MRRPAFTGISGSTSALNSLISASITSRRMPEWPRPRLDSFSAISRRTDERAIGSPTPTACDSTRFFCSSSSWSCGMCVLARRPKPVLMP